MPHDSDHAVQGDSILEVPRLDPVDLLQSAKPKRKEGTEVQLCVHQGHPQGNFIRVATHTRHSLRLMVLMVLLPDGGAHSAKDWR